MLVSVNLSQLHRVIATRRIHRWLMRVGVVALLLPLLLQWTIAYVVGDNARLLPPQLQNARNLLIVTAHPDDECLFFAPSILGVLDRDSHVKGALLSLSTGNHYDLGNLRKAELAGSCSSLGIDSSRCAALDHPEIQDNPSFWWNTDLIQTLVHEYVEKWDIDTIITFDSGGISGHINHRAVSAAIRDYVSSDAAAPDAYMVVTTSLWRKYTFLGDLPLTSLPFCRRILAAFVTPSASQETRFADKALVASTWHRYRKTREAFGHHDSQYSWDRHLYLVLSRYVWFNDLVKVPRGQRV